MAALRIGAELDLVHHKAGHRNVQRHRLHRADEILRIRGDDFFFASDQRGGGSALLGNDLVIDLPRQQAERQADHAGAVRQHPLDREMGLAGIGGAQHRGHALCRPRCRPVAVTCGSHGLGHSAFPQPTASRSLCVRKACGWLWKICEQ